MVQEVNNFGAWKHTLKKKMPLRVYTWCCFTWEDCYLQSFKHEFIVDNYHQVPCRRKNSVRYPWLNLIWLENFGVSMTTNIQMENKRPRETLCILSRSVELLLSNEILFGAIIGKNEAKCSVWWANGKARVLPTFCLSCPSWQPRRLLYHNLRLQYLSI